MISQSLLNSIGQSIKKPSVQLDCELTTDGTSIDAVMKNWSDTSYNVSKIQRIVIPPTHRSGRMVELTNTAYCDCDFVTTTQTTDNLFIPFCIISGGKEYVNVIR